MPNGFQLFNADGSLQFDSSNRLGRFVDSFTTTAVNGSRVVAGMQAAGAPIAMIVSQLNGSEPVITFSGDTVYWAFDSSNTDNQPVAVIVVVH
jgi:hypothetical protein